MSLVPDFVTIDSAPPAEPPISVSNRLAITRNSLMASWLNAPAPARAPDR